MNYQGNSLDNLHTGDTRIDPGDLYVQENLTVNGNIDVKSITATELDITPPGCLKSDCVEEQTANSFELKNSAGTTALSIVDTDDIKISSKLQTANVSNISGGSLSLTHDGSPKVVIDGSEVKINDPIKCDSIQEISTDGFELKNAAGTTVANITQTDKLEVPQELVSRIHEDSTGNNYVRLDNTLSTGALVYSDSKTASLDGGASVILNARGGDIDLLATGNVNIKNAYTMPTTDGTANQVLLTDGKGVCSFQDAPGTSERAVINKFNMLTPKYSYSSGVYTNIENTATGSKVITDAEFPVFSSVRMNLRGVLNSNSTGSNTAQGVLRLDINSQGYLFNSDTIDWKQTTADYAILDCQILISRTSLSEIMVGLSGFIIQVGNSGVAESSVPIWSSYAANPQFKTYVPANDLTIQFQWLSVDPTYYLYMVANRYTIDLISAIPVAVAGFSTSDHSLLSNLLIDSHTQYANINGRSGGQTLIGGTAASNNLTLESTSNATKGDVVCIGDLRPNATNTYDLGTSSINFKDLHLSGTVYIDAVPIYDTVNNLRIGSAAGDSITSGFNNILLGLDAGTALTTTQNNIGVGGSSLLVCTTGNDNVAIGESSLGSLTTGERNVAIGRLSGDNGVNVITTGQLNVFIGYAASTSLSSCNYSIAIGNSAITTASNQMMIGSATASTSITDILPGITNNTDLGSASLKFKDFYLSGAANVGSLDAGSGDIETGGRLFCQSGTAALPGFAFDGDRDTGINRSAGANTISISTEGIERFRISQTKINCMLTTRPFTDDLYDLGEGSNRWRDIYAGNATIQTSDEKQKKDIVDSDKGLDFIKSLKPRKYKMINGTRPHYGLLAQEVKQAMEGSDFAGYIKSPVYGKDEQGKDTEDIVDYAYGLRYAEFIAPLIKAIHELDAKIKILESA